MRPHVTIGLACAAMLSALAFAGCTAPVESQDVDETTGTTADAYSTVRVYGIYTVRKNTDCKVRFCTGYDIQKVNERTAARHVDSLAFEDSAIEAVALNPDGSIPDGGILVRGYVGLPEGPWNKVPLVVTGAFRGMPYVDAARGDRFYRVVDYMLPDAFLAFELNTGLTAQLVHIDVSSAVMPHADMAWLEDRVLHHDAVVAGHLHDLDSPRHILDVNQVFLRLPDVERTCKPVPTSCRAGMMPAFTRDADRCLVFDQCIAVDACPIHVGNLPNHCARGYSPSYWMADVKGCMDYACDPTFTIK